jgi:hypothetical protein
MLHMFPFVRVGTRRTRDKQEIMTRLEALAADQSEIKRYIALLMESETTIVKAPDWPVGCSAPWLMALMRGVAGRGQGSACRR